MSPYRHAYQIYKIYVALLITRRFITEPVLESCAGIDVHEKKVDVCIAHGPLDKSQKFEIRSFSTMTSDLEDLMSWLKKYKVTTIGMESTGDYWKPILNLMEGEFANSSCQCSAPQIHSLEENRHHGLQEDFHIAEVPDLPLD